jgi:cytochrome c oxidase subunit 3
MIKIQKTNLVLDPSPWPISTAFSVYILLTGMVSSYHLYVHANMYLLYGFILFLSVFSLWIRDILRDAFIHRLVPILNGALRRAFILFIVSEVMFFAAFF